MEIIQVVGLALITTVLVLIIKEQKPMFAFLLTAFTGITIFLFLIGKISTVISVLEELANKAEINTIFLKTILKIIGIAYIAEFARKSCGMPARKRSLPRLSWPVKC